MKLKFALAAIITLTSLSSFADRDEDLWALSALGQRMAHGDSRSQGGYQSQYDGYRQEPLRPMSERDRDLESLKHVFEQRIVCISTNERGERYYGRGSSRQEATDYANQDCYSTGSQFCVVRQCANR